MKKNIILYIVIITVFGCISFFPQYSLAASSREKGSEIITYEGCMTFKRGVTSSGSWLSTNESCQSRGATPLTPAFECPVGTIPYTGNGNSPYAGAFNPDGGALLSQNSMCQFVCCKP